MKEPSVIPFINSLAKRESTTWWPNGAGMPFAFFDVENTPPQETRGIAAFSVFTSPHE
jgi:hypothetical protein